MMLGLYSLTFAFGGVLLGASVFLGGGDGDGDMDKDFDKDFDLDGDADADVDVDVDVDADVDADMDVHGDLEPGTALQSMEDLGDDAVAWMWIPFLSMRFWSFGSASFGATGLLLSATAVPAAVTAGIAGVTGLGLGTGAAWVFRQLKTNVVSGATGFGRLAGEEATVTLPIRPDGIGKIRVETSTGNIALTARSGDGVVFEVGTVVLITSVVDGVADVTGLKSLPG